MLARSYPHSFFFNDPPTTEIYTLSLHDALPISPQTIAADWWAHPPRQRRGQGAPAKPRSEEHTSELQSLTNLVCRLLLEKKKKQRQQIDIDKHVLELPAAVGTDHVQLNSRIPRV